MTSIRAIPTRYHHDRSNEMAIRKRLDEAEQWMSRHTAQLSRPIARVSWSSGVCRGTGLLILFFVVAEIFS